MRDMSFPQISVVICTYNRCDSLRQTLESLKSQVMAEDIRLEILVVDNNSTDKTKEVVVKAGSWLRWPVRYVFEPQQGLSRARNRGIQGSHGEFIVFTDDDVVLDSHWVQSLYETYIRHNADCVGGKILLLWSQSLPEWLLVEKLRRKVCGLLGALDLGTETRLVKAKRADFLNGANIAFRKSVFDEVGLFRTELGIKGTHRFVGEETDLLFRLEKAGKRIFYTPDAVVRHKVSLAHTTIRHLRRRTFEGGRASVLVSDSKSVRIPPWWLRECFGNGSRALWAHGRGYKTQGVEYELEFWTQLGQIVGALQRRYGSCQSSV